MDELTQTCMDHLWSVDRDLQNEAFTTLLEATAQPVDWAYQVWDKLLAGLTDPDNHVRAIAAQILANLAKSDPEQRMLKDFHALLAITKDQRFVTARHCLQALWKVGAAGRQQQEMWVAGLAGRFGECGSEKNCTLIRYDIIQGFWNLYDAVLDDRIKEKALALIETEEDIKYRKKYASLWRDR